MTRRRPRRLPPRSTGASCSTRCSACGAAISPCAFPATGHRWTARSPTRSTRSSRRTRRSPSSCAASARWSGKEGKTRERAKFDHSKGAWGEMEASVNTLIDDLLRPTTEVTGAIAAVAQGHLTQTIRLDVDGRPLEGEFLRSATIVNTMIQQLGVFTSEVTRVAREVGSDGKLGGQAQVPGVSGVWKDLTDSVNSMASNLTAQVRNISEVTIAVASGDLSRKITVDVRGEILQLKEAINTMVDQLRSFASEVTRVAREVGTEGKLGGQAVVPGVAGHLEGPHRQRQRDGGQPDGAGAQHRRGHHGRGPRRPVAQDHRERERRNPGAQGHHQHDGRSAQRLRRRGDARRARGRHRRQARRAGAGARRRRHVEGPDRQRELHGEQPDGAGAQHRRSGDRDRPRRPVEEDHRERERRDPAAQGNAQHDGRPAQRVRLGSHPRGARSRHRRPAGRAGGGAGRGRHLEGPHRQRESARGQPDDAGPQHRRGDDGRRARRPVAQDHRGREGRGARAQGHDQHDGRSAQRLRRRGDARRARSRHRRKAGRPGAGAGRRRHLEGPDRQRQLDGEQPDRPGPQHRRGGHGRGARRPVAQDHRGREGRDPRAQGHAQHHGRPAQRLRLAK